KIKFARGFLLEPRSDEWRRGTAANLLSFYRTNDERRVFDRRDYGPGFRFRKFVGLVVDSLVFPAVQTGFELRWVGSLQPRIERQVFLCPKRLALPLPFDVYPQRG